MTELAFVPVLVLDLRLFAELVLAVEDMLSLLLGTANEACGVCERTTEGGRPRVLGRASEDVEKTEAVSDV